MLQGHGSQGSVFRCTLTPVDANGQPTGAAQYKRALKFCRRRRVNVIRHNLMTEIRSAWCVPDSSVFGLCSMLCTIDEGEDSIWKLRCCTWLFAWREIQKLNILACAPCVCSSILAVLQCEAMFFGANMRSNWQLAC